MLFQYTLTFYLTLGWACFLSAQEIPLNPNQSSQNGLRQGKWTILYDAQWNVVSDRSQSKYYRLITYKDGLPIGKVTDYYKDGQKQWEGFLISDRPEALMDGKAVWYDKMGRIIKEATYEEGQLISQKQLQPEVPEPKLDDWASLNEAGTQAYHKGDFAQTQLIFEKALKQAEKEFGTKHPNYAQSLNNLGFIYNTKGDLTRAEKLYRQAVEVYEKVLGKNHPDYALSLGNLANVYEAQGAYVQAEKLMTQSLEIYRGYGEDQPDFALAANNLALLYQKTGKYHLAKPLYQKALDIFQQSYGEKDANTGAVINNLAKLYQVQGYYSQAQSLYEKALLIRRESLGEGHLQFAEACDNLAGLYNILANYGAAEPLYKKALVIRKQIFGDVHADVALSCNNLGTLYYYQGDFSLAKDYYLQSLNIYAQAHRAQHPDYARTCNNLATLYNAQGNYKEAEHYYQKALAIRRQVLGENHPNFAGSLNNLATFYYKKGDYKKTESLLKEALDIIGKVSGEKHPDYANSTNNLASLYHKLGKYSEAEKLYKQAIAIKENTLGEQHLDYASSLNNLAALYETQNKYAAAVPLVQKSSQIVIGQTQSNFAHLSEREKSIFFNTFNYFNFFNGLILKAIPQDPSLSSWLYNTVLASKGLLLQSTLKIRRAILEKGDQELLQQFSLWQDKRDLLAQLQNQSRATIKKKGIDIIQLTTEINNLEKDLSLKSQAFAQSVNPRPYTWQDVQQNLKPKEAAIEIIRVAYKDQPQDSVIYVALIVKAKTKNQPEIVWLPNGNDLENKYLNYYRNSIKSIDKFSYAQFWAPLAQQLNGIQKVFLSADGVYHQINLNTLFNQAKGHFLLDEQEIYLVTTTKDMIKDSRRPSLSPGESILMGRPKYDLSARKHISLAQQVPKAIRGEDLDFFNPQEEIASLNFPDLPGTELETREIFKLLKSKGEKVALYLGENALEEVVKQAKNPRVLHLATHGFFFEKKKKKTNTNTSATRVNDGDLDFDIAGLHTSKSQSQDFQQALKHPLMRSGLVLTGASTYAQNKEKYEAEDGLLTANEVQNLNLDYTELVVLSACETGKGNIQPGEGVYGLQRGFQQAGAKSILMSLWSVDDKATQELMTTFYQEWLKGKPKRQAFLIAQKKLKEKYKYPFYWGAFVLVEK